MPITLPPWLQVSPLDQAQAGQGAQSQVNAMMSAGQQAKQRQEEIGLEKERLSKEEQQMSVNQELSRQKMSLLTQSSARSYQATQAYQDAIKGGMDPVKAAMMYGPAMSGGRMTGYAPLFTGFEKANAPPPPAFAPVPVKDASGNVIGYSDKSGHVSYMRPAAAPKMSDMDKAAVANIYRELDQIDQGYIFPRTGVLTEDQKRAARLKRDQLNQQLKSIQDKYRADLPAPAIADPGVTRANLPAGPTATNNPAGWGGTMSRLQGERTTNAVAPMASSEDPVGLFQ